MTVSARRSAGGFDLTLELDRADLLPGRLVSGRAVVSSRGGGSIRAARVTLVGVETYRYDRTETDANGNTRTVTHTATHDLPPVPLGVLGATAFAPGESRDVAIQVPVPSLGPPSFDATDVRVEWELRLNLDVPLFDPTLTLPVTILQPTALLRAGVVDVAPFALYPEADITGDGWAGTLWLDPMPLVVGAPFKGRLTLSTGETREVQEVRLELRAQIKATVSGGREESVPVWVGRLAGAGTFGPGSTYEFEGSLPDRSVPTMRSPHGRSDASFRVVVAVAWARDPNLVRDVSICSTVEL